MPRTQAFIPVANGLDQRLDERLRSPEALSTLTNAYYRRNNAVTKRPGFTQESDACVSFDPSQGTEPGNLANQGTPRAIFSTGSELCVRGYRSLYAYVDGKWYNKGAVSPFTGKQTTPFVSAVNYGSGDCATDGLKTFHVATTQQLGTALWPGSGWNTSFVFQVRHDDRELVPSTTIATVSGFGVAWLNSARVVRPKSPGISADFIPSVQRSSAVVGTNGTLEFYNSDSINVFGPWQTYNDLYNSGTDSGSFARHDSCPFDSSIVSSNWGFVYVRVLPLGGTELYFARCTDAGIDATGSIPQIGMDEWRTCSIAYDEVADRILIVGMANNLARLYVIHPATFAVTAVVLTPTNPAPIGCGVVRGTFDGVSSYVVGLSTAQTGAPQRHSLDIISANAAGVISSTVLHNTYGVSKPWFYDGRAYMAAKPMFGEAQNLVANETSNDDGYSGEVILDLFGLRMNPTPGIPELEPHVVGRYNFGVTHEKSVGGTANEYDMQRGAFANVTTAAAYPSKVRYATQRIVQKVPGQPPVKSGDVVELDYEGKMLQGATTRGSATIGGGSVSWYAGRRVEELGYASGPFLSSFSYTASASGTLSAGVYQYRGVFECYDEAGNLVRSVPGPSGKFEIPGGGGGPYYVTLRFYNLTTTDRFANGKTFRVSVFRAGSDGVFYRCLRPLADSTVIDTNYQTNSIVDLGNQYEPIYTQSGAELEAAGPDGAAFSVTTSQRVWLAGFFRRDRVQYSKPYNAATASEYALAPEFNDAFAYLTPGGQAVNGIAEMDDKVIVFTDTNIYAIAGNGPDDGGRGNDFSGLQLISSDTGCIDPRSIVSFPGGVMFQAKSGIFVLGRDFQLTFLGAQVRDTVDEYNEITSACLVPSNNHVRFTCRKNGGQSIVLIYDLDQSAWLRWEPRKLVAGLPVALNIVGSCLHQQEYYLLDADGLVWREDASTYFDDGSIFVPMTVATSWLQGAQQSGIQRIRQVASLCKSNDPHNLLVELYQDFAVGPSQSYTFTASDIANQKLRELVEMRVQTQKCTAFKIRISDSAAPSTITGQGYECGGFTVELAGKRGLYKPGTQQRN